MKKIKHINIAGNLIKIKNKKKMPKDVCGMAHFTKNEIWIASSLKKNDDLYGVCLTHEILHHILYILNHHSINENEEVVDSISQLIWQVVKQVIDGNGNVQN